MICDWPWLTMRMGWVPPFPMRTVSGRRERQPWLGAARASGLGQERLVPVCLLTKGRDEIWGSALHSLESNFQFEFT